MSLVDFVCYLDMGSGAVRRCTPLLNGCLVQDLAFRARSMWELLGLLMLRVRGA